MKLQFLKLSQSIRRFFVAVLCILWCTSAVAGDETLTCYGTVDKIRLGSWTGLYVQPSFNANRMRICDLDGSYSQPDWGTQVPGDVCSKWLGMLTSAYQSQSVIYFWYENMNTSDTCENLPENSNAPSPSSVGLELEIPSS